MKVATDSSLVETVNGKDALLPAIWTEVEKQFNQNASHGESVPIDFYNNFGFEIMHENNGGMEYLTTADADGKTMVYVYFTRKIYTLKFHYYGIKAGQTQIATNTNGDSYGGADAILDDHDELDFGYSSGGKIDGKGWYNESMKVRDNNAMPVLETITITAKYGADLREVWPAARAEEHVLVEENSGYKPQVVSWATTAGKYRDEAIAPSSTHFYEATLMGLYAAMDEEIIRDPKDPTKTHPLIAYWSGQYSVSYYRYNHCYEVPGLNIDSDGVIRLSFWNGSQELEDTLYLVPWDNEAFTRYGFDDLLPVSYDGLPRR